MFACLFSTFAATNTASACNTQHMYITVAPCAALYSVVQVLTPNLSHSATQQPSRAQHTETSPPKSSAEFDRQTDSLFSNSKKLCCTHTHTSAYVCVFAAAAHACLLACDCRGFAVACCWFLPTAVAFGVTNVTAAVRL